MYIKDPPPPGRAIALQPPPLPYAYPLPCPPDPMDPEDRAALQLQEPLFSARPRLRFKVEEDVTRGGSEVGGWVLRSSGTRGGAWLQDGAVAHVLRDMGNKGHPG